jgi:hypothetical protein
MSLRNILIILIGVLTIFALQTVQSEESSGVAVTTVTPESAPPAQVPAANSSLASGSFGRQATWSLVKAKVSGAILSVEFEVSGESCENEYIPLQDISYIDENTAKKLTVLKDEGGQWMAGPLDDDRLRAKACGGKSKMWMKFPAPPAETKTITINISQLGSLDSIPVQR